MKHRMPQKSPETLPPLKRHLDYVLELDEVRTTSCRLVVHKTATAGFLIVKSRTTDSCAPAARASFSVTLSISDAESLNAKRFAGKPVAYKLVGTPNPLVFAHPQSMIGQRAQFAFKNLWVTPHSDQERYPAGDYTIGSHGGAGLSEWTKQVSTSRSVSLACCSAWTLDNITTLARNFAPKRSALCLHKQFSPI